MSSLIHLLDSTPSTNLYAKEHYKELADNTLIIAKTQTAGRGRRGKTWLSPDDCNVYATLLIKNVNDINFAGAIVGLAGLATLKEFAPNLDFFIKWPNDIYVGTAKIAGILCESCEIKNGRVSTIGCGIGINVNLPVEYLKMIDQAATSLFFETKIKFDLNFFRERLAFFTNRYYIMYLYSHKLLIDEWRNANKLVGKIIEVIDSNNLHMRGKFVDIGNSGELILEPIAEDSSEIGESQEVKRLAFLCGEVSLSKNKDFLKLI